MSMIRTALAAVLVALATPATADWPTVAPDDAGFAADLPARLDEALRADANAGVHAVVLARDGRLVHEAYRDGDDEILGDGSSAA